MFKIAMLMKSCFSIALFYASFCLANSLNAQIGKQFPSERKVIKDPVTGTLLTFLTSTPNGDSKIYQTHNQWTSFHFTQSTQRGKGAAIAFAFIASLRTLRETNSKQ